MALNVARREEGTWGRRNVDELERGDELDVGSVKTWEGVGVKMVIERGIYVRNE